MKRYAFECLRSSCCRLFLCACAYLLCGCAQDSLQEEGRGVIRLGTKSPTRTVNSLADLSAVGDNVGIYGVCTAVATVGSSAGNRPWGNDLIMDNVRTTAIDASTGNISWEKTYFYPVETDRYVEFCAYYPYAEVAATIPSSERFYLEAPAVGEAPILHFTLNGQDDIMFADPVIGGRLLKPQGLEFRHVLTQLQFQLSDPYNAMTNEKLLGISLLGVNTQSSMEIEFGALGAWSAPAQLDVPGIDVGEGILISGMSSQPQMVGREIMLQPGQSEFHIRVETSKAVYDDVVIRPTSSIGGVAETAFAAGRSYLITLSFQAKAEIAISASVVPWVMAGTGSAIVQ